ncbi:MAG TPA: hypothetical protein VMS17_09410 [Gemmataceae bacterium]|nr:hypothetical protein [Gemmataceae bacterium]
MAIKVVIIVSGGNVQQCYADVDNVNVELIDFDNIKEEGSEALERAEDRIKEVAASMREVHPTGPLTSYD